MNEKPKYYPEVEPLPKYLIRLDKYIDQLEEEKKALTDALKSIEKVTDDGDLPLLKVIHQIAFKTLRL